MPTTVRPPTPDGGFNGWSFFGGILLTLGLFAIGFVGFKYYRLRSGTGADYNRF
jgi:CD164 antigen